MGRACRTGYRSGRSTLLGRFRKWLLLSFATHEHASISYEALTAHLSRPMTITEPLQESVALKADGRCGAEPTNVSETLRAQQDEPAAAPEAIDSSEPIHDDVQSSSSLEKEAMSAVDDEKDFGMKQKFASSLHGQMLTSISDHIERHMMPLYSHPQQRQRWGDTQLHPHTNWGDVFFDLFYVSA